MPLRVWALALLGLLGFFSRAQVVYLPLDDRPPNWAPCGWDLVVCPPKGVYQGPLGADLPQLRLWLLSTPGKKLVASLDALAYGGLLQSRHLPLPPEDALARLLPLLSWRVKYGGELFLYGVLPRWDAKSREKNLEVLQALSPWAGLPEAYLEALWDDALRDSPAPKEAASLSYPARPGADEGGQVLLLRALRPGLRVKVVYEDPGLPSRLTPYEALPLGETVDRILKSASSAKVLERPDLVLYVYGGLNPRRAALDLMALMRESWVALADLSRVNRGDSRLVDYLLRLGLYGRLASYASWGTPANNLGSALAQGGLFLGREGRLPRLAEAYLQYAWGEAGRPWVRAHLPEPLPEASSLVVSVLQPLLEGVDLEGLHILLKGVDFPWKRSFEAEFSYSLRKAIRLAFPSPSGVDLTP